MKTIRVKKLPKNFRGLDLTGQQFGQWSVLGFAYINKSRPGGATMWVCRCSCGKRALISLGNLRSGRTTRCQSCASKISRNRTHGMSKSRTYNIWRNLREKNALCKEWLDFTKFYDDVSTIESNEVLIRRHKNLQFSFWNCEIVTEEEKKRRTRENYAKLVATRIGSDPNDPEVIERLCNVSHQRLWQLQKKALGLCTQCGKPSDGKTLCWLCR